MILTPGTADAAVYVIDAPMFGIGIDAGDDVSVDCDAGKVRVYDDGVPTTYTTNCNAVTALGVTAVGAFDNTIDVSAMTTADFPLATTGLVGGEGNDSILGGQKSDAIQGRQGNDTLIGGDGIDGVADTGDVNLTLTNASLTGLGTDSLSGFERAWLTGGPGPNTLDASGFTGNVTLEGLAGDDTLMPGIGDSTLSGGVGIDKLQLEGIFGVVVLDHESLAFIEDEPSVSLDASVESIERVDVTGNQSANKLDLSGFPGDVTLQGLGGDDTIVGGQGIESLDGGSGNDELRDTIYEWTNAASTLNGGSGVDRYKNAFWEASPALEFGVHVAVDDLVFHEWPPGGLKEEGVKYTIHDVEKIFVTGTPKHDIVRVTTFPGPVEMRLGAGDDVAKGGKKRDKLLGQDGKDTLNGGRGSDTMKGGDGNDEHLAKDGRQDTVKCGRGRDIVFSDRRDRVAGDCESIGVRRTPPPPPPSP